MVTAFAITEAALAALDQAGSIAPAALAAATGATVPQVVGVLARDVRFARVAGAGCWHFQLDGLFVAAPRQRRRKAAAEAALGPQPEHESVRRAREQRFRLVACLKEHGKSGATLARLAGEMRSTAADVRPLLAELEERGAVTTSHWHEFLMFSLVAGAAEAVA